MLNIFVHIGYKMLCSFRIINVTVPASMLSCKKRFVVQIQMYNTHTSIRIGNVNKRLENVARQWILFGFVVVVAVLIRICTHRHKFSIPFKRASVLNSYSKLHTSYFNGFNWRFACCRSSLFLLLLLPPPRFLLFVLLITLVNDIAKYNDDITL